MNKPRGLFFIVRRDFDNNKQDCVIGDTMTEDDARKHCEILAQYEQKLGKPAGVYTILECVRVIPASGQR